MIYNNVDVALQVWHCLDTRHHAVTAAEMYGGNHSFL